MSSANLALPDDTPYGAGVVMSASAVEPISAALLARGVCRTLEQLGFASLLEFPLANGRRADVLALNKTGDLLIVEIKTSVADFRADHKWSAYRGYSDRLYFAVPKDFPHALIPDECGLMVADSYGAALLRDGALTKLNAGRRRALTMRFALLSATRLRRFVDPEAARLDGI
jgi:hypothetical protein